MKSCRYLVAAILVASLGWACSNATHTNPPQDGPGEAADPALGSSAPRPGPSATTSGCSDDSGCDAAQYCDVGSDCVAPGVCTRRPGTCDGSFFFNATVCTCSGVTSDRCGASYGRESVRYDGACKPADATGAAPLPRTCATTSQCAGAEKCCTFFGEGSPSCRADPKECPLEACVDDASCPSGQSCEGGACRVAARATCGDKRCSKDQGCVLGKGVARCVGTRDKVSSASYENPVLPGRYGCTQPSDCGEGYSCCSGGALGTLTAACQVTCDASNNATVCRSDNDCVRFAEIVCKDAACRSAVRCVNDEPIGGEVPPIRVCRRQ